MEVKSEITSKEKRFREKARGRKENMEEQREEEDIEKGKQKERRYAKDIFRTTRCLLSECSEIYYKLPLFFFFCFFCC